MASTAFISAVESPRLDAISGENLNDEREIWELLWMLEFLYIQKITKQNKTKNNVSVCALLSILSNYKEPLWTMFGTAEYPITSKPILTLIPGPDSGPNPNTLY